MTNRIKKFYPSYKNAHEIIDKLLHDEINFKINFLDVGCGKGYIIKKFGSSCRLGVGMDIDKQIVKEAKMSVKLPNTFFILGDLERMPLKDKSFPIIYCQFVIEHLRNPSLAFKEMVRALKKGGKLIIVTPNLLNPIVFLNKILPTSIKNTLKYTLFGSINPCPVFYRCNLVGKIDKKLKYHGLRRKKLIMVGHPLIFVSWSIILWILLDKISDKISFFQIFKDVMILVYSK
jgi:SAM-dependent methyltransferase